eukprot:TRINITY_DN791_c0_g1_i1.p3 TRINITY_DN791_c0_g1~~TRINITY_DN791_c0_g1_i1.p3  ORF type:complete len:100 (+),score=12.82 TRINITY_DN791_c0_g1_i1:296-595(+)
MNARLRIAREQVSRASEAVRVRGSGRPMAAHAAPMAVRQVQQPVPVAGRVGQLTVSAAEFAEFQAWKAELQAISAGGAGAGAGAGAEEDAGSESDDPEA